MELKQKESKSTFVVACSDISVKFSSITQNTWAYLYDALS